MACPLTGIVQKLCDLFICLPFLHPENPREQIMGKRNCDASGIVAWSSKRSFADRFSLGNSYAQMRRFILGGTVEKPMCKTKDVASVNV